MSDTPAPDPVRFSVEHSSRHPCPACGARQWLQGVSYYQCDACGYRDNATPGAILGREAAGGDEKIPSPPCVP